MENMCFTKQNNTFQQKNLVLLSKTLLLNEKLCFIKQNNTFEWKSLVLLSKTELFRETQENLQKTKKHKKNK